jgi:hypothetical protein
LNFLAGISISKFFDNKFLINKYLLQTGDQAVLGNGIGSTIIFNANIEGKDSKNDLSRMMTGYIN